MSTEVRSVVSIIAKLLAVPEESIKPENRLQDFGVDSLATLELLLEIERVYSIEIPDDFVAPETPVRHLEEIVRRLRMKLPLYYASV